METVYAREAFEELSQQRTALVTIDVHRGHLDPAVATLPLTPERSAALMERTHPFVRAIRAHGLPIVHVTTVYRDRQEILANPYWRFQSRLTDSPRSKIAEHNLDHLPGIEFMPGLVDEGDKIVDAKKRYDCMLGTDLELTLRSQGIETLLLIGVNTSSCVIATAFSASVRDFGVFVVEECVDTILGQELHEAASTVIGGSFGWMISSETVLDVLGSRAGASASAA